MSLTNFSWGAGPQAYFGRGANLTVTGYFTKKNGDLVNSGVSADFFYAAAQHVGGTGASMETVVMSPNFIFDAYRFNITSDYSTDVPELLLDEVNAVAYTPV